MSYPKKISRETILASAMAFIEDHGVAELSMRTLAANLGVTPNALYRYFASKADLEFAMADEGGKLLLADLEQAASGLAPPDDIRAMARAYIRFARRYPKLYAMKMQHCALNDDKPGSHDAIWAFVMQLAGQLPTAWDPKDLAMSLWAFLHGMVELDRANLLEGRDPEATIEVGLDVMMAGLLAHISAQASADGSTLKSR
ncbi:MAG: TetR/AcrR family transcriptional regulator [Aquabacterium sp.]|uniref:TetR/AcrR family transcriptional regulator n=1 Tax=Aquabacterium sp. TaxID=1872578 RepID=UPI0025B9823D|nr:TetR/AcrR family transcriptional regulator [Aquabacterium sp.]MBI5926505.1 TetR/AcrR family transcriptional regulator [Aquabacterium sp.]